MYWQDSDHEQRYVVPDDVVDVAFSIRARTLPVDHAWALAQALLAALPWLAGEALAGVHSIHVAESGNGWMRPDAATDVLYPSRRTKLVLRVPGARVEEVQHLSGQTLDVAGHGVAVEQGAVRPLSDLTTLFARYVAAGQADENAFLQAMAAQLQALDIRPKKMLCGIEHALATPDGPVRTRSLMIAELAPAESVRLQQHGLGPRRLLGCGLFLPHKDIQRVQAVLD
jgi:CRISPR-associated protein Cas6